MIYPDDFDTLVSQVADLNKLDRETADLVVGVVGDCHSIDPATGKVVAKLPSGRTLFIKWPEDENED
ncbi:MAG: hypothetical protein OJI67_08670 [Prosthecobacter sp.]|nr:hypothetical protein [Prosthecobacter sp.]